jgi:hypothetical protein
MPNVMYLELAYPILLRVCSVSNMVFKFIAVNSNNQQDLLNSSKYFIVIDCEHSLHICISTANKPQVIIIDHPGGSSPLSRLG